MIVKDDFLPNPARVRRQAMQAPFVDWPGPDGEVYKRVFLTDVPGLQEGVEALLGPVDMLGMAYRLNFDGEMPNAAIHSDLGWGTHALVLYLCEGEGGTAFWQHEATGLSRMPEGDQQAFDQLSADWNDETKWRQTNLVRVKFNRAVIYESALFHSRYPFAAFGDSPATGRLIAVAFFTPRS